MNKDNLIQIFNHYIENFEYINNKDNKEIYKWEIAYRFRTMMDDALAAPEEDFAPALYNIKKMTQNLIDNYAQPFYGLYKFAKKYPQKVQAMFKSLFSAESGDTKEKHQKILEFLEKSHALRDELFPNSYLYTDDYRSVSTYLFLYNPDSNYIFKSTHALAFADCIEFYDEWGSGTNIRLDVFYRMCDAVVEAIKKYEPLMATDRSRFIGKDGAPRTDLFADENKHVLMFDIMYCCSTYGMFHGISYNRPNSKERILMKERKEKAIECRNKVEEARTAMNRLTDAEQYLQSCFQLGTKIIHRKFKEGTVVENDGEYVTIDFSSETKKMDPVTAVCSRFLTFGQPEVNERMSEYLPILAKKQVIISGLRYAETELEKYAEYLD